MEVFITGTEQIMQVHNIEDCEGSHCCIHNPSDHHMKDWPLHWRDDRRIFERIDPEGVGHPDPDDIEYHRKKGDNISIHGCNGLCHPGNFEKYLYDKKKENKIMDIKMNINWKEDFKYFLEQKGIWEAYKNLFDEYNEVTFEEYEFDTPNDFVIDPFDWCNTVEGEEFWSDIDDDWASYYRYWKKESLD
jgi:hypothetical protein